MALSTLKAKSVKAANKEMSEMDEMLSFEHTPRAHSNLGPLVYQSIVVTTGLFWLHHDFQGVELIVWQLVTSLL